MVLFVVGVYVSLFALFCFFVCFFVCFYYDFGVFFLFPYFILPHRRLQFRHILLFLHRAAISSTDAFYNLFPKNKQNLKLAIRTVYQQPFLYLRANFCSVFLIVCFLLPT